MSITTRYLYRQMMRPLVATLVIALLVLVIERTLKILDLVLGWRGGLGLMVEMITYLVPQYIGLALPMAFFLAVCMTFGRMSRDSELDAYFAAGVGLHRLAGPPLALGAILTVIAALTLSYLQPYGRYAYNAAVYALTNSSIYSLVRENTFTTLGDNTFLVGRVSEPGRRFERVFIYDREGAAGSTVTTAQKAEIGEQTTPERLVLKLRDGLRQTVEDPWSTNGRPGSITARFREYQAILESSTEPAFRPRGGHERELTLAELWHGKVNPPEGVDPNDVRAELHGRLVRIATVLVLPFLAMPLGLSRRRVFRSYGIAVGLAVLVIYDQIIQIGETLVDDGVAPPWLVIWLPFTVLLLLGLALFAHVAFRVPGDALAQRWSALLDAAAGLWRRFPAGRASVS